MPAESSLLKNGHAREVRLETDGKGENPVVVKRFRHPRPWYAIFDRRRAHREHALLEYLHRRGLSVPRPLGLAKAGGRWELRMQWIPRARTLEEHLEARLTGGPGPAGGWERLLVRLATQVAGLHRGGVEHPDLHPGNVLVDAAGVPWLIDFHQARLRPRAAGPGAPELGDQVERWVAMVRECLPARLRWRFLFAWRAALGGEHAADLTELLQNGLQLEERGRRLRRRQVVRGLARWRRSSGRLRVAREDGRRRLVRRASPPAGNGKGGGADPADGYVMRGRGLEPAWLSAARLEEHHVPCVRPLSRSLGGGEEEALYSWPEGTRPLFVTHRESAWPAELARSLGELLGTLHDRGLELTRWSTEALAVAPSRRLLLLPPSGLQDFDPTDENAELEARLARLREAEGAWALIEKGTSRRELIAGYLDAFAGQPRERAKLDRLWRS